MAVRKKVGASSAQTLDDDARWGGLDPFCGEITQWFPIGLDLLDWLVSPEGGLPGGRMVEVFGDTSSGKTTLALSVAVGCARAGGSVYYMDCETALTHSALDRVGLRHDQVEITIPKTLEEVHGAIRAVVDNRRTVDEPTLIVWDSVAGVKTSKTCEKILAGEQEPVAAEARMNSNFFGGGIIQLMGGTKICLLVLNQIRDKVGTILFGGKTTTTPGGKALAYFSSVRLNLIRTGQLKGREGQPVPGYFLTVKTEKNKLFRDRLSVEVPIYYVGGPDNRMSLIYFLEEEKVLPSSGGRFQWKDKTYTRSGLREFLGTSDRDLQEFRALAKQTFQKRI